MKPLLHRLWQHIRANCFWQLCLLLAIWKIPSNQSAFLGWMTASSFAYSNMLLKRNA